MENIDSSLLPTFLIVGAARGGTTSLYNYLAQHPQIKMSALKEPSFFYFYENENDQSFNQKGNVFSLSEYQKLFKSDKPYQIRGDASTPYLYTYKKTIESIKKIYGEHYRELKIIISLRNPVDRAYSQYLAYRRNMLENLSFADALDSEQKRKSERFSYDYFYKSKGFYYEQVKAFLENFDNVLIYLFEDFKKNPQEILDRVSDFLGTEQKFTFDASEKHNVSGVPKSQFIQALWMTDFKMKKFLKPLVPKKIKTSIIRIIKENNLEKIDMDEVVRQDLKLEFKSDVEKLQGLINRNLSSWID